MFLCRPCDFSICADCEAVNPSPTSLLDVPAAGPLDCGDLLEGSDCQLAELELRKELQTSPTPFRDVSPAAVESPAAEAGGGGDAEAAREAAERAERTRLHKLFRRQRPGLRRLG